MLFFGTLVSSVVDRDETYLEDGFALGRGIMGGNSFVLIRRNYAGRFADPNKVFVDQSRAVEHLPRWSYSHSTNFAQWKM